MIRTRLTAELAFPNAPKPLPSLALPKMLLVILGTTLLKDIFPNTYKKKETRY
jgi:hypothetical protein